MNLIFFLFLFCVVIGESVALKRCYICSFSVIDIDRSCLTISNSTQTVDCAATYCTIMRQEFVDPSGTVASFTRGCEDTPDFLNHEVTDFTYRTFYRACTENLCNTGDGVQSVGGGSLSPRPVVTGENLLVPGTGKGTVIGATLMTTVLAMLTFIL